jgi:hypothetical protein
LGAHWPEGVVDRSSIRLLRPGLEVAVNLSPTAHDGLPPWGWKVWES